jgi:hypothetical protein
MMVNKDDLNDYMKKIFLWIQIGWIYDLVLFKKDKSSCLSVTMEGMNFEYKTWLLVDAIISLAFVGFVISLILQFYCTKARILILYR